MGKTLGPHPDRTTFSARGTTRNLHPEAKATAAAMKKQYNVFDYYKVGKPLEGRKSWEI